MLFHIKTWPLCLTNVFPQDNHNTSVYGRGALWHTPFCNTILKRHALKGQTLLKLVFTALFKVKLHFCCFAARGREESSES